MSQNEPRDGSRPGGWVPGIGWVALLRDLDEDDMVEVDGGESQDSTALSLAGWYEPGSPHIVRYWADGTEPVAPGDEAARARAHAFEAWIAYETTAMEHDWPATNERTDAASTLAGAMAPWFAATDPGSGGQTGTPGADG